MSSTSPSGSYAANRQARLGGCRKPGRGARRTPGERQQPAVPAVDQVVDQRVDRSLGLVGGVEVLRPVPPHVEVEARVAQRPPAAAAEVADRLGAALGLRRVVGEVAGLVDRAPEPDHGDLAASTLSDRHLARRGQVERVHALVERPPQQRLALGPVLTEGEPRRDQACPGGREVGGVTGPSSPEPRGGGHGAGRCGGRRNTEVTRTGNSLHARNTARRAVKPPATKVLDNAAGPGTTASSHPRAASCSLFSDGGSVDGYYAFMLVATALVLMMTVPALALFYGGMCRSKSVLNMMMMSYVASRSRHRLRAVGLVEGCRGIGNGS